MPASDPMNDPNALWLYEEIMLLALRDKQGTISTGYSEYAVAGAVVAELLLDQRISLDGSKRQLVNLNDPKRTGDPIMDACLDKMEAAKRRASLENWITRLACIPKLRHKVAHQLCERGILQAEEDKVLLVFSRKIYPELNPEPERAIIERLREAIFSDDSEVDPRTVVLISLADGADLLKENFDRKEIARRKERIEAIVHGDATGKATKDVIEACEAAVMVATVFPVMVAAAAAAIS